jgi:hypothetical protein
MFPNCICLAQSNDCREFFKSISTEWKNDSLTKNNFRSKIYKEILACKSHNLRADEVFKYFGKPAKTEKWIQGNQKGIGYSYYYWDSYTIPGEVHFERMYITFNFDEDGNFLYIAENMGCG